MARCFVTRQLPGSALERLASQHEVEIWPERLPPTAAELRERASDTEGLLCLLTDQVDAELIAACPKLRVISNYAVGCDNIDVAAATARGIAVGNTPDVLTEATADLTFALLLAAARNLVAAHENVRTRDWLTWEPAGLLGADVHGATLGIVGYGRIGQAVARRAAGFAMEVLFTTSSSDRADFEQLLASADFVSLHCPLTDATRHLVDAEALALMKPSAYLINTARGQIVDQSALIEALKHGEIAGAALDVTDPEPPPPDDPLLTAPNLTLVSHIGSATHATRERMAELAVDNLVAGLSGEPMPNRVN